MVGEVAPVVAQQAPGAVFDTDRAQGADDPDGDEHADELGQIHVHEFGEIRGQGFLQGQAVAEADDRREARCLGAGVGPQHADHKQDGQQAERQHREVVDVRQHEKLIDRRDRQHDQRGDAEGHDGGRRIVETGVEGAHHGGDDGGRTAVLPAADDPQAAGEPDRQKRRKCGAGRQAHVPVHRALFNPGEQVGERGGKRFAAAGVLEQRMAVAEGGHQVVEAGEEAGREKGGPIGVACRGGGKGFQSGPQPIGGAQTGSALDPCGHFDDEPARVGRKRMSVGAQRTQPVVQAVDDRDQEERAAVQGAYHVGGFAQVGSVEGQVGGQQMDLGFGGGELPPFPRGFGGAAALEHVKRPLIGLAQPVVEARQQRGADRPRKDQAVNDGGAHDADGDLLAARDGDVEDVAGRIDAGEGDDRRGVAGQHHQIAARRAVEQGDEQAGADPHRHGETQQHRRVHQRRYQENRHRGAEQGAEEPVDRLRAHGAGERMADDQRGGHRPVGAWQADAEADEERQHRGGEAVEREDGDVPVETQRREEAKHRRRGRDAGRHRGRPARAGWRRCRRPAPWRGAGCARR